MKHLSAMQRNEIAFLNAHPLGPRMTPSNISEYLDINKATVRTICSEQSNLHADDSGQPASKVTPRRNTGKKRRSVDRNDQHSKATDNQSNDCRWPLVSAILMALLYFCCIYYISSIRISKDKWIYMHKWIFYDHLETRLDISREAAETLHSYVERFYASSKFTEENHSALLAAIDRQSDIHEQLVKLKPKKNHYSNKSPFDPSSAYSKDVAIGMLTILFTDILEENITNTST